MAEAVIRDGVLMCMVTYCREMSLALPLTGRVEVPEGVHTISAHAFWGTDIEEVHLPSSLRYIRTGAFRECKKLTAINLPDGVLTLSAHAFRDCKSLREIHLPKSLRTLAPGIFEGTAIEEFVVPPNLTNLGNIERTFDAGDRIRIVWPYTVAGSLDRAVDPAKTWELEADKMPFDRVPVSLRKAVCQSVARRYLEGKKFTAKYLRSCRLWAKRHNDLRTDEIVKFLLLQNALPIEETGKLLERALNENKPDLTAALLEYQNRNPSSAEGELEKQYRETFPE